MVKSCSCYEGWKCRIYTKVIKMYRCDISNLYSSTNSTLYNVKAIVELDLYIYSNYISRIVYDKHC